MGNILVHSNSEGGVMNIPNDPCHVDSDKGDMDDGWDTLI